VFLGVLSIHLSLNLLQDVSFRDNYSVTSDRQTDTTVADHTECSILRSAKTVAAAIKTEEQET